MGHAQLSAPLARVSAWVLLLVWLAELGALAGGGRIVSGIAAAGLAIFVLFALVRASRHIRMLFALIAGIATLLAFWAGEPGLLARGFERAQIFGAFFPAVLFLRATAEVSPRLPQLQRGVEQLSPVQARGWTLYGAHGLGSVLNVGAMAVLAPVVSRGADDARRLQLAQAAAHGVGSAIMWSPLFIAMAFTSQLVPQAALWQAILIGAGTGALGLLLSHRMFMPDLRVGALVAALGHLRPLWAPIAVMVGGVVACTTLLGFSGLQAVAVVLPALCVVYLAVRGREAARDAWERAFASFGRLADELLIVVGAMLLGAVVGALPPVVALAEGMSPSALTGAPLVVAMVVILVALGQTGLHPMIGVSIFVPVFASGAFGISPPLLVAAAVFAWGLSASVAIWTLPVAVAATSFNVPVARLYSRAAIRYLLLVGVLGLVYLAMINTWLAARAAA